LVGYIRQVCGAEMLYVDYNWMLKKQTKPSKSKYVVNAGGISVVYLINIVIISVVVTFIIYLLNT
jgi:hypothetical protein